MCLCFSFHRCFNFTGSLSEQGDEYKKESVLEEGSSPSVRLPVEKGEDVSERPAHPASWTASVNGLQSRYSTGQRYVTSANLEKKHGRQEKLRDERMIYATQICRAYGLLANERVGCFWLTGRVRAAGVVGKGRRDVLTALCKPTGVGAAILCLSHVRKKARPGHLWELCAVWKWHSYTGLINRATRWSARAQYVLHFSRRGPSSVYDIYMAVLCCEYSKLDYRQQ